MSSHEEHASLSMFTFHTGLAINKRIVLEKYYWELYYIKVGGHVLIQKGRQKFFLNVGKTFIITKTKCTDLPYYTSHKNVKNIF